MKRSIPFWFGTAAIAAVLLTAGVANATSQIYLTDAEQVKLSTAVVVATIGEATVNDKGPYGGPLTLTRVRVDEVLYGTAPAEIVIEQMGGTIGNRTLYIPGDARFEVGEKAVLFVRKVDGKWYLTALEQSKYELRDGGRLGRTMHRTLSGGMFTRDDQGRLVEFHEPVDRPVKVLSKFKGQLEALEEAK